jgi:hypothetical protein
LNRNPVETEENLRLVHDGMPERRTGVVFLGLVVATNFIPWMQLTESGLDTAFASPAESALVIAICFLAIAGLFTAWMLGRRLPPGRGPRVRRPRDAGLMLAILAAVTNLGLAAILWERISRGAAPLSHEMRWFVPVWCLFVLPAQIAAAFFKGRASIPFSGASSLSPRTGPGTVPPVSSL